MKPTKLICAALASLMLLGTPVAAEELNVATFVLLKHSTNTILFEWFGEELETRLNGSLTMKPHPAGQLCPDPVQQCKRAVESMADITFGLQDYAPALCNKICM